MEEVIAVDGINTFSRKSVGNKKKKNEWEINCGDRKDKSGRKEDVRSGNQG